MDPKLQEWVERTAVPLEAKGSFTVYQLQPEMKHEDKKNKVRVFTVGPKKDREVKAVLLLGETGSGKTLFCNTFLNRVFGVAKEDRIRLNLKDQMDPASKNPIYSQTEYISVYLIYHQDGMPYEYNYMVIDTPGFGDTGGQDIDKVNDSCFRFYLSDETWIKHLNSVGIVWKASDLRYTEKNRKILRMMRDLLCFDTKAITDVLMTFTVSENTNALKVIEEAGIEYQEVFFFNNEPIYSTCPQDDKREKKYTIQWEEMVDSQGKFLDSLNKRKAVDLNISGRLLLNRLKYNSEQESRKLGLRGKQLPRVDWNSVKVPDLSENNILLDDGEHSHFCIKCKRVCDSECRNDHKSHSWQRKIGYTGQLINGAATILATLMNYMPTGDGLEEIKFIVPYVSGLLVGVGVVVGAVFYFKSKKTSQFHATEGNNPCPQCSHLGTDHEIREKYITKDANFDLKMEIAKKDQYLRVVGKEADIEAEINACKPRLKELGVQILS
ncbi:uncharacterized protein LOC125033969 [Penaeus chinensis]|uniref:uncharacterized protein LOC125033969 n=1 Tax=Penaeus chinensis TaxID=139456 RepID=UPI001FB7C6A9|nr:uncharacterized protein LOC125033969 [Penaeus chinensis]XP_047481529.1 uncharacterized protein LOC125033969 [Penaeus chinensis]